MDVRWGVETEKSTFAGTLEVSQENVLLETVDVHYCVGDRS